MEDLEASNSAQISIAQLSSSTKYIADGEVLIGDSRTGNPACFLPPQWKSCLSVCRELFACLRMSLSLGTPGSNRVCEGQRPGKPDHERVELDVSPHIVVDQARIESRKIA